MPAGRAGGGCSADIARFGERKRDLLRRLRLLADGTPSHDHLGDILASLDATAFQRRFVAWTASSTGVDPDVIAIDGKTLHRSYQTKGGSDPIHMVSAFAARQRLVLGQIKVAGKSNEITAIPKLLAMMAIEGAVVTVDAIGCQREIAQAIIDRKADDILALKGNQGTLRDDVALFVAEQKANGSRTRSSAATRPSRATTAASRRGPPPSSIGSTGSTTIAGQASRASSWSMRNARSTAGSGPKPGSTSPPSSCWPT